MKKTIAIVLAITAVLLSCKEPDPDDSNSTTITAFGKTAKVTGDASISDFDSLASKLGTALSGIDSTFDNLSTTEKNQLNNIMSRGIRITDSINAPESVNGVLNVGAGYLRSKTPTLILTEIFVLIDNHKFVVAAQGKVQLASIEERTVPVTQIV